MRLLLLFLSYLTTLKVYDVEATSANLRARKKPAKRFVVSSGGNSTERLRVIAIGTSVTWGVGLKDPNKQAYVKILSHDGVNLGVRASDPSYPSICTQSMIGDDAIYDVIIVEYERSYERGLDHLISRLRGRFPEALIIVTEMWTLHGITVTDDKGEKHELIDWLGKHGFKQNTAESRKFVAEIKNHQFHFNDQRLNARTKYMNSLVEKYGVVLYRWSYTEHSVHDLINKHHTAIATDYNHLSSRGHKSLAKEFRNIIAREKVQRSDVVGSWGDGDVCKNWISDPTQQAGLVTNGKMKLFNKEAGKWAIDFEKGGYVVINSPFADKRKVAFTYMTTGPAPSIYPKTKITFSRWQDGPAKILDPTDHNYNYPVHVQATTIVGVVHPGMNYIKITLMENTGHPFRLVGYSITNEIMGVSQRYRKPIRLKEPIH